MGFTVIDLINLIALLLSVTGTYIMFYYSPVVNSQTYLYQKSELAEIKKRDMRKNKMVRRGMFLLFIGFILQAIAIFLNIATK